MDFAVFGISAVLLVKLIVNVAKTYGLPTKFALIAAIVLGVGLSVLNEMAGMYPVFMFWYKTAWTGLMVGLVAAEVYDTGKALTTIGVSLKNLDEFAKDSNL